MTTHQPIILPVAAENPITHDCSTRKLQQAISQVPALLFAVLVGSRAQAKHREDSDWDIAVYWKTTDSMTRIQLHEMLRHELAKAVAVSDTKIDLIDIRDARLAMRALVAEEGILLHANDELAWAKFLTRTWRELEDVYWERDHAA